jgi:DNA helicase-2/ATP-dependent DNA helicase PcrA
VPGLAEHRRKQSSIFPDTSRQPNPIRQPATLPFDLRGDADVLPRYQGNVTKFRDALRERGMEEERRLCYVALTRARDVLVASCAYWYEGPADAFHPGTFLDQIAAHPACEVLERAECPEESPLVEARRARAGEWPPKARPADADELFPDGWHAASLEAARDPGSVERRAGALDPRDRGELERLRAGHRERLALIGERGAVADGPASPASLSVTGVLDYERCPKMFYWSSVRPLPRRPSEAARVGTDVHRWIEQQARGQAALFDVDARPDLAPSEREGAGGAEPALRDAFRGSRFFGVRPLFTERPFVLWLDGVVVRGRIDAVFGEPDGPWEIVDYKTGAVPDGDDPVAGLQLDLYALAAAEVWGKRPEDLTLTYVYLSEGVERSRPAGDPSATRARLVASLSAMRTGAYDPAPGEHCRWCDFLTFCEAGRAFTGSEATGGRGSGARAES